MTREKTTIDNPTDDDDPWIDWYLKFRAAVLGGELKTLTQVNEYVRQTRGDIPTSAPSIPAAMFIQQNIGITFPDRAPELMKALWTPDWARDSARNQTVAAMRSLGISVDEPLWNTEVVPARPVTT